LISPDWLIEDGLLRYSDCTGVSFSRTTVDYDAIIRFKHGLLEKAWTNFTNARSAELRVTFDQFCHEQRAWLDDYALFRALKVRYNGGYYLEWPTELIQRVPKALAQVRRELANQVDQVRFAQFLLFRQGSALRNAPELKECA
jgi:4-alpha-glucanotransferase